MIIIILILSRNMTTLQSYIRNRDEYARLRGPKQFSKTIFSNQYSLREKTERNNNYSMSRGNRSFQQKLALPVINEYKRRTLLSDLENKKSEAITRCFKAKCDSIGASRGIRSKTEPLSTNEGKLKPPRANISINVEQVRMKPVDKYFYKLENIRLAERLLAIKPSPSIRRSGQKRFYLQQKSYRSQLSRNLSNLKSRKKIRLDAKWIT